MYRGLGEIALKTGERVEFGVVEAPDPEWAERIEKLLAHKGDPWNWQNSELLRYPTDVETYFYLLHRDGAPFSNIMLCLAHGVGLFGHVWTNPEDRRKGAASRIMSTLMEDFRRRGGQALFLGTDFDAPPYHIYAREGFIGIEDRSGYMAYYTPGAERFEAWYFAGGPARVAELQWRHWPASAALLLGDFGGMLRLVCAKIKHRASPEGPLLPFLRRQRSGGARRLSILEKPDTTAVVGIAACGDDPLTYGQTVVDVYCHPRFWPHAGELLATLELPAGGRLAAYADSGCPAKIAALKAFGFREVARLPDFTPADVADTSRLEVTVLMK